MKKQILRFAIAAAMIGSMTMSCSSEKKAGSGSDSTSSDSASTMSTPSTTTPDSAKTDTTTKDTTKKP